MTQSHYTPARTRLLVAIALLGSGAGVPAQEPAIRLDASYSGEVWHNTLGGIESGSAYLDSLGLAARIDTEALWGVSGTQVLIEGLYNNGNGLSPNLVGDLQTVSNIESGPNEARLYQALVTTRLGDDGSLRAGLYDVNSEFDVLDSANLFINSAHGIGTDIGQTGRNGPSIFPLTSLGARLAWRLSDVWRGRVAVLDGVPGKRGAPNEMGVALGGGDGASSSRNWRAAARLPPCWRVPGPTQPPSIPGEPAIPAQPTPPAAIAESTFGANGGQVRTWRRSPATAGPAGASTRLSTSSARA